MTGDLARTPPPAVEAAEQPLGPADFATMARVGEAMQRLADSLGRTVDTMAGRHPRPYRVRSTRPDR